ncbi:MAG: hypothetical protein L3K52_15160 [Candidatus Thiothrix sulfatifontis]|nr:MAG: hypothetical protein L3K52_15160 [Candidatus Thiothrix sulfatifontis]
MVAQTAAGVMFAIFAGSCSGAWSGAVGRGLAGLGVLCRSVSSGFLRGCGFECSEFS